MLSDSMLNDLSLTLQMVVTSLAFLVFMCRIARFRLNAWYWIGFTIVNSVPYIPLANFYHISDFWQLGLLLVTVFIFGKNLASHWMKIFTALYTKVFYDVVARFVFFGIYAKFILPHFPESLAYSRWFPMVNLLVTVVQVIIVLLANEFIIRIMRMNFEFLQERQGQKRVQGMMRPTVFLLGSYFFIQYFSYLFVSLKLISFETSLTFRGYMSELFTLLILFFIATFNQKMTLYYEEQLLHQKDEELQSITDYSHQIEELYREIRSFRHDYSNILTSLRYSADQEDLEGVRKTLSEVIGDSDQRLKTNQFEVANLALIEHPALKGVLSSKLSKAIDLGISVKVEVLERIGIPEKIATLDFIRIVSILLDNAIEAASDSEQKRLSISYFKDHGNSILIVDNTMVDTKLSIASLYQEGFSTKGDNRGIGLATVKRLLADYPQVATRTSVIDGHFKQYFRFKS